MNRVLLTGHGGFIGHHCLDYWLSNTDWDFVCLDSFRHSDSSLRRVVEVADNPRVTTFKHDLSVFIDKPLANLIQQSGGPDIIVNMASDSDVDRSVINPVPCLRNNYDLMISMLEYASSVGNLRAFIHISTDEVYGEILDGVGHLEWSRINPSNPYAASKAAQEALAISYWRSYDVPVIIVNIMNVIGERQNRNKFLPKIIRSILNNVEVPIFCNEDSGVIGSRVYTHAKNVADAIKYIINNLPAKLYKDQSYLDRYNVCGDEEVSNLQLAELVAKVMGKDLRHRLIPGISFRGDRYLLDGGKLRNLGWVPPMNLNDSLGQIVSWSVANPHWL